jgi:hypothetical protein
MGVRLACCLVALCVGVVACGGVDAADDPARATGGSAGEDGAGAGAGGDGAGSGGLASAGAAGSSGAPQAASGGASSGSGGASSSSGGASPGSGGGGGKLCQPGLPCGGLHTCTDSCFSEQCCQLVCWCESGTLECNLQC